jgi:hypothetical protein
MRNAAPGLPICVTLIKSLTSLTIGGAIDAQDSPTKCGSEINTGQTE